jgi:tripartite-type tricarboxylate transporter receptor subunit TctC
VRKLPVSYGAGLLLALNTLSCAAAGAGAAYPSKPMRWVVPYAAGGPTEVVGRVVGAKVSETLGQQVVVDLRPGGNSILGSEIVARSPADGYTLLLALPAFAINPAVYSKLPYDTVRDFIPVTLLASASYLMLVGSGVPAKSPQELVALAKARPGELAFGSGGTASPAHLAVELFMQKAGIRMNHIPYKGGAPALTDLAGGQIQVLVNPALSATPLIKSGRIRAIAVTGPSRSDLMPELPTVSEAGWPGYEVTTWYGLFAPAKTDMAVVQRIAGAVAAALRDPGVRSRLAALDAEPAATTPEVFRKFIDAELIRWRSVVQAAQIRAE